MTVRVAEKMGTMENSGTGQGAGWVAGAAAVGALGCPDQTLTRLPLPPPRLGDGRPASRFHALGTHGAWRRSCSDEGSEEGARDTSQSPFSSGLHPRSRSEAHPPSSPVLHHQLCQGWGLLGTEGDSAVGTWSSRLGGWGGAGGSPRGAGRSSRLRISRYSSSACWYLFCFR